MNHRRWKTAAVLAFAFAARGAAEPAVLPEAVDAGWNGTKVCEVLEDDPSVRIARCTFPPGVGHERHWHPAHWGYTLQGGTMRTTDSSGTKTRIIPTGASWKSDGVGWHEVLNVGNQTAVFLLVEPKAAK